MLMRFSRLHKEPESVHSVTANLREVSYKFAKAQRAMASLILTIRPVYSTFAKALGLDSYADKAEP